MQITSMLSAGYLQPSIQISAAKRDLKIAEEDSQHNRILKNNKAAHESRINGDAAALSRQEQEVLAQEQSIKARAGSAEVHTIYHYTLGSNGKKYITGASVSLKGDEQDLNRVGGGITSKDVVKQSRYESESRKVESSQDKSESRSTDDSSKKNGYTGADLSEEEKDMVRELQQRDREVRNHEAAHQAAAGAFGGGASFTYEKGPDGKSYAVGGEVPIQIKTGSTPEETIRNMRQVQMAANAPADPSGQDKNVAARAASIMAKAQQDLANERSHSGVVMAKSDPIVNDWRHYPDEPDYSKKGASNVLAEIREMKIQEQLLAAA